MPSKKKIALAAAVAAAVMAPSAFATNGYFSHGYGMKAKGMAGAATALADDAFGAANNPASMVWVGARMDIGLDVFSPNRTASRNGSTGGAAVGDGKSESDNTAFYVPEIGYNTMLNATMAFGVTVYGNGGMNTDYPGKVINPSPTCAAFPGGLATNANLLCGDGALGVNLSQLIVAPTFSLKAGSNNSFGVAPLFGYQQFKAYGLQGFSGFSTDATKLTNNGSDTATGWGLRVGWMGKISDAVSLGAAYSTKIDMTKFEQYKGLFAEYGDFDIPANYSIGAAFKAGQNTTIALDFQHIDYSGVKSVANSSRNYGTTTTNSLGPDNGRGFGWSDVDVYKLGVEYKSSDKMTLRAGYSKGDNPIQARDVTFNILAPAVIETHITLGFTYAMDKSSELTLAFMHAPSNSVSGASLYDDFLGAGAGGTEKIEMDQNSLGVSWSQKW